MSSVNLQNLMVNIANNQAMAKKNQVASGNVDSSPFESLMNDDIGNGIDAVTSSEEEAGDSTFKEGLNTELQLAESLIDDPIFDKSFMDSGKNLGELTDDVEGASGELSLEFDVNDWLAVQNSNGLNGIASVNINHGSESELSEIGGTNLDLTELDAIQTTIIDSLAAESGYSFQNAEFQLHLDNDSALQLAIWVPLTSVATGKLAQTNTGSNTLLVSRMLGDAAQHKSTGTTVDSGENSLRQVSFNLHFQPGNQSNINNASTTAVKQVTTITSKETHRRENAQNSGLASQANSEWLNKKFTLIKGEDGITIWYRDYHTEESSSVEYLLKLEKELSQQINIKQIGLNGKVVYFNESALKGEKNGS